MPNLNLALPYTLLIPKDEALNVSRLLALIYASHPLRGAKNVIVLEPGMLATMREVAQALARQSGEDPDIFWQQWIDAARPDAN